MYRLLQVLLILICCSILSSKTAAQGVSGYTAIEYDDATNTIFAYSETDLDLDLTCDYHAKVSLAVYDQNWHIINQVYEAEDTTRFGFVSVSESFTASAGMTYTAIGSHSAYADYSNMYDFYPYAIYYYDNLNLTFFQSQSIYQPWYYYFFNQPIQPLEVNNPVIDLGSTYDTDSITTAGDDVHFVNVAVDDATPVD